MLTSNVDREDREDPPLGGRATRHFRGIYISSMC